MSGDPGMAMGPDNDQWFFTWALNAAVGLLYALVGALWLHIGQSKKEALSAAEGVRRELLAANAIEREDRAARGTEYREALDDIRNEIRANQRAAGEAHQRMLDKLGELIARLGQVPTRDEMKADGVERELRVMTALRASKEG
jgi:hypothetical protein